MTLMELLETLVALPPEALGEQAFMVRKDMDGVHYNSISLVVCQTHADGTHALVVSLGPNESWVE